MGVGRMPKINFTKQSQKTPVSPLRSKFLNFTINSTVHWNISINAPHFKEHLCGVFKRSYSNIIRKYIFREFPPSRNVLARNDRQLNPLFEILLTVRFNNMRCNNIKIRLFVIIFLYLNIARREIQPSVTGLTHAVRYGGILCTITDFGHCAFWPTLMANLANCVKWQSYVDRATSAGSHGEFSLFPVPIPLGLPTSARPSAHVRTRPPSHFGSFRVGQFGKIVYGTKTEYKLSIIYLARFVRQDARVIN